MKSRVHPVALAFACASAPPPAAPPPEPPPPPPKSVSPEQALREKIAKDPKDFAALCNLADIVRRRGALDEAAGLYEGARDVMPDDGRPIVGLASIERHRGHADKTMELVVEALARNLKDASAWNQLGLVLLEQKNWPSAILVINKGIGLEPGRAELYSNRGLAEMGAGSVGAAARDFAKAVELDGKLVAARLNLGAIFLDNLDFPGAEQHFEAALASAPDEVPARVDALLGRGRARLGQKKAKEAIADYEKALAVRPDEPRALYDLGRAYADLGDNARALEYYRRLMAIKPGDAEVEKMIKRLEAMLQTPGPPPVPPPGTGATPAPPPEERK